MPRKLDRRLVRFYKLGSDFGVEVGLVEPDGPAHKAGLQRGDVIVLAGGKVVASIDDIFRILGEKLVGQPLRLVAIRLKDRLEFEVVPEEAR